MAVENIYKYAAQHALRFPFKGSISVEDLFNLKLTDLDTVYKALKREEKKDEEESLMAVQNTEDTELSVKIAIVRDIFEDKQAEAEARKNAAAKKEYNQKIAAIIAEKEDAALRDKSVDELRGMMQE